MRHCRQTSEQKSLCLGHSHHSPCKSHCVWDSLATLHAKVTVCGTLSPLSKQKSLCVGHSRHSPCKSHCVWDSLATLHAKVTVCGTLSPLSKQKSLCVGHSHLSPSKSHCVWDTLTSLQAKSYCVWDTLTSLQAKSYCVWDTLASLHAKISVCGKLSPLSKQKSLKNACASPQKDECDATFLRAGKPVIQYLKFFFIPECLFLTKKQGFFLPSPVGCISFFPQYKKDNYWD